MTHVRDDADTAGKYMHISDAARYLGVSTKTLQRRSEAGFITVYREPGSARKYFLKEDLDRFMVKVGS